MWRRNKWTLISCWRCSISPSQPFCFFVQFTGSTQVSLIPSQSRDALMFKYLFYTYPRRTSDSVCSTVALTKLIESWNVASEQNGPLAAFGLWFAWREPIKLLCQSSPSWEHRLRSQVGWSFCCLQLIFAFGWRSFWSFPIYRFQNVCIDQGFQVDGQSYSSKFHWVGSLHHSHHLFYRCLLTSLVQNHYLYSTCTC